MSRIAVILTAAGSGTRLGADIPKAFMNVGGIPMVVRAARLFGDMPIIVTAPAGHEAQMQQVLTEALIDAQVVTGGTTRAESVLAGLSALDDEIDAVLVHDAARCMTAHSIIEEVRRATLACGAAVPAVPVTDTLRNRDGEFLGAVIDRESLVAVQTPQGFDRALLQRAFDAAVQRGDLAAATDESSLVAALGEPVTYTTGDAANIKITTPADLRMANGQLTGASSTGIGVDAHRFDIESSGPLALAGLVWPGVSALAGHSDGDVACHALCDALFSAAMLGDLGTQFGVDDPQWAGASGATLLAEAVQRVRQAGWEPQSATVQIIGNTPKIGPRRTEAEAVLAGLLGVDVALSATTTDGMGLTGEGAGIAAVAVASVRRREP